MEAPDGLAGEPLKCPKCGALGRVPLQARPAAPRTKPLMELSLAEMPPRSPGQSMHLPPGPLPAPARSGKPLLIWAVIVGLLAAASVGGYLLMPMSNRRAELASLRDENAQLKAEITKLKNTQVTAASAQAQAGAADGQQEPAGVSEKKVVLPARDFETLTTTRERFNSGIKVGSIGWVNSASVVKVLDETTAFVDVEPDGYMQHLDVLFEGISTNGFADDMNWRPFSWFKIVDTRKIGDTTYFVAWPIVQAGAQ